MTEQEWIGCDRCVAQAMWLVKGVDGELYFCGHHKNKNFEALDKWAYEMIELNKKEETPKLEEAEL
jgi:hypothetical protein